MSRETEKMNKELQKFLDENLKEGMGRKQVNDLVDEFINQYNEKIGNQEFFLSEENAETSEDFFELAMEAEDETTALKLAKKALKLDPDNLDAGLMIAEFSAVDQVDLMERMEKLLKDAHRIMKEKGYMTQENIGDFWLITETRSYMIIKFEYIKILKKCGMIKAAIAECEDMLRLNKNDNLGVRYTLMFLYAFMEDEEKALKLYKKSNEKNVQMLLSLSILYFRKRNLEESLKYLKKIESIVKDTRKFLKDVLDGKMEKYSAQIYDMGYRLFTSDELAISFIENHFIFDIDNGYIEWAYNRLKKKLKMVKRKKK